MSAKPKVGETVYIYDGNYRVYRQDSSGRYTGGGPIYREYYRPFVITGEDKRSWILDGGRRISKNRVLTQAQVNDACWAHEHRYRISREVDKCDADKLRVIAEIVGYRWDAP